MNRTLLLALGASLLVACNGDTDTDTEDTDTEDTDTVAPPLVSISGSVSEIFARTPAAEGTCVDAVDPSAALDGGELNILASTTVDAEGNYVVTDVDVRDAPLAIFIVVRDCDNSGDTIFPSGTGIAADSYSDAVAGDELSRDALFVSAATATGVDASLAGIGSTATLADGSVMGFVLDASGNPVADATVTCSACDETEIYYVDGDAATGGLLAGAEGINTATQQGVGLALVMAGPVANYTVDHPSMTFGAGLFGSIPGLASVTAWTETSE